MKNLVHRLSYWTLRATCAILTLLPLGFSYVLARFIGSFAFHVLRFRRQVTMDNLRIAFGAEMGAAALAKIGAESYRQIAMSFIELLIAPKLHRQIQDILAPGDFSLIQRLLHQGRGLILVSGHLGSWELQGAAIATAMSVPVVVAAKPQSNRYIDDFITRRRTAFGMRMVKTRAARKQLLLALKKGQAVGLVADQYAGRKGVFVNFFGRTAATHLGPAQLALKFKAPMLLCAAIRLGPGKFKMLAQEVAVREDDTVATLTQRHVKILEGFIRLYPEQYFWLHGRWKTKKKKRVS